MLLSYRRFRRKYLRPILLFLFFVFSIDAIRLVRRRPDTYRTDPSEVQRQSGNGALANTTVFIASVHRNTEEILRTAWNEAILGLVDYFGPQNIYFSAIESGSQDESKAALLDLQTLLDMKGVANTISLGQTVWEQLDEINARPPPDVRAPTWIWNAAETQWELRRIPYLARVRNQAMELLKELEGKGITFDKVLWLNDVVFDTKDIVTLLNTRDGEYAAACSMDYKHAPRYYDTFALRDDMGLKTISQYWPWFQSPTSRAAAEINAPVRVMSCWNGVVVFDSAPFYASSPLLFRGIEDSLADFHLEGSECCLIHADNYLSSEKGVWLNPNVRVGYGVDAYRQIKVNHFPSPFWAVLGAWVNRIKSGRIAIQTQLEARVVSQRLEQWMAETPDGDVPRYEPGAPCLINEMQVMWENGWRHL
ncbi:putative polysaccharide export protein [Rosellinia necatrix]|uniref:Putative polysaccharide export protein n=1 Tax=Rosellinia necatrix TaxID=77044 RepID=A0A1W2TD62_ROSNE|nr:putative polysaccharide export protein [Rosellinia necatrix]